MARTADLVILLPGISGSVLCKNGSDLWGTTSGAISRAIFTGGDSIRDLEMTGDDNTLDDLGDGVTAPRLVPDLHMLPGFWKIDGYTKASRRLITDLGLKQGANYYEFPYDWRRDNRIAARKLAKFAEERLREWRRESDNAQAKLILLAHSMGGLVARYFIEVLGGWKETRALVTMGTPYFGSLNALGFLVNGYAKGIGPLQIDYSNVLASFTSVYQLLPTYPCVAMEEATLKRITDLPQLAHVDPTRAKDAFGFHQEIIDAQAKNASDGSYISGKYNIYPIVGVEQPTFQSAMVSGGKMTLLRRHGTDDFGGDGTVPRVSATPLELREKGAEMFAAECHGSLQNYDAVLVQLVGALAGQAIDFSKYRDRTEAPVKLALDIDDVYTADKREEVSVYPTQGEPRLIGLIQDTRTDRTVARVDFRRRPDGGQRASFSLPRGTYRISVSGAHNISPVTDTFLVA